MIVLAITSRIFLRNLQKPAPPTLPNVLNIVSEEDPLVTHGITLGNRKYGKYYLNLSLGGYTVT